LHLGQFDQAQFVIVPKSSKLVIHFLRISQESAQQYHNVIFEHNHTLSHELLYARFAWALMKIVGSFQLNARKFNFLNRSKRWGHDGNSSNPGTRGQGEPSQGGRPKRKRTDNTSDNGDDGDTSPTYHPGSILGHQNGLDNLPLQSNAWLSDVLVKMAPGTPSSLDRDAQEIEKDLAIAASTLPFFGGCIVYENESVLTSISVDPTLQANAYHYNEINWYPGRGVVERRKRAYLDQHSNIRAHSDHLLPESYDASDDETF
jgi:hypothetical protein